MFDVCQSVGLSVLSVCLSVCYMDLFPLSFCSNHASLGFSRVFLSLSDACEPACLLRCVTDRKTKVLFSLVFVLVVCRL